MNGLKFYSELDTTAQAVARQHMGKQVAHQPRTATEKRALKTFLKKLGLGYDSYVTMLEDEDLGNYDTQTKPQSYAVNLLFSGTWTIYNPLPSATYESRDLIALSRLINLGYVFNKLGISLLPALKPYLEALIKVSTVYQRATEKQFDTVLTGHVIQPLELTLSVSKDRTQQIAYPEFMNETDIDLREVTDAINNIRLTLAKEHRRISLHRTMMEDDTALFTEQGASILSNLPKVFSAMRSTPPEVGSPNSNLAQEDLEKQQQKITELEQQLAKEKLVLENLRSEVVAWGEVNATALRDAKVRKAVAVTIAEHPSRVDPATVQQVYQMYPDILT